MTNAIRFRCTANRSKTHPHCRQADMSSRMTMTHDIPSRSSIFTVPAKCWPWSSRVHCWNSGKFCRLRWTQTVIVIMQAARYRTHRSDFNPFCGDDYDRPVILINTRRLVGIQVKLIDAKQVVCLPGATLDKLKRTGSV